MTIDHLDTPIAAEADPSSCAELLSDRIDRVERIVIKLRDPQLRAQVELVGDAIVASLRNGGTIFFLGNGGSAADSAHLAAEFVGRCTRERGPLASVNLADSLAIVTALANDYGYETVFERQVNALVRPGDVVIAMSGSGRSENVLRALRAARHIGAVAIGLTGESGGLMADCADHVLRAPAHEIGRVQEVHKIWGHIWAEWAEIAVFGSSPS